VAVHLCRFQLDEALPDETKPESAACNHLREGTRDRKISAIPQKARTADCKSCVSYSPHFY
jgi:hypothetical protein